MLESEILCGLPYLCQSQLLLQYRLVISYKFICIINFKFYYLLFIFLGSSKKNPRNSSGSETKINEEQEASLTDEQQEALLTLQLALPGTLFFYSSICILYLLSFLLQRSTRLRLKRRRKNTLKYLILHPWVSYIFILFTK